MGQSEVLRSFLRYNPGQLPLIIFDGIAKAPKGILDSLVYPAEPMQ